MKPLVYLFVRQFVNGIKRAVGSPRRLISILVGLGYFFGVIIRPWDKSSDPISKMASKSFNFTQVDFHATVFLIFGILSMFLCIGIFGYRNTFKPADVDVLFPTPVNNKMVMYFRLFRDYWPTLFFPFFIAIFAFKPGQSFFQSWSKSDPVGLSNAMRGGIISWVLQSMVWVAVGYAISFYLAKNEKTADRMTKIIGWTIAATITSIFIGYTVFVNMKGVSWFNTVSFTQLLPIKLILIVPEAGTLVTLGAYTGNAGAFTAGASILLIIISACLLFASKNSDWMYDQAATRGFQAQTVRDMMQKGDGMGIMAERARKGSIKRGRIATWISNWTLKGGWALVYKELLIQARTGFWTTLLFMVMVAGMGIMFLTIPSKRNPEILPMIYLGIVGFMGATMGSGTAYNSFVETLRRVEVIKPLPLNAQQIAFHEVVSKSFFSIAVSLVPYIIGLIYKPQFWMYHLSGIIAAPMLSMAIVGVIFLVVVLFPDFDDPTQRSFRGLMQLIGMVIVMAPTFGIFIGFGMIKQSLLIPAVISVGMNTLFLFLTATFAGRFYADFNPSE